MREILIFVFVLVNINDVVFQVRIVTFLENFYLLYKQVSYQVEFRSELRQNFCYSIVIVSVNVYCHDFLVGVFLLRFHCSYKT